MSIKTTQRITRANALAVLLSEIPLLPNDALGMLMDTLADTDQSKHLSKFDNFIVFDGERLRSVIENLGSMMESSVMIVEEL